MLPAWRLSTVMAISRRTNWRGHLLLGQIPPRDVVVILDKDCEEGRFTKIVNKAHVRTPDVRLKMSEELIRQFVTRHRQDQLLCRDIGLSNACINCCRERCLRPCGGYDMG
jgi:hypothetical protein